MILIVWFLAWIIFGGGTVSVSPEVGGWAITLIVCASIDFGFALGKD